ncbi:MAG: sigma factor-like helix-turn-helix DNA-binding protein, partial [Phycisphaerales bacterium]
AKKSHDKMIDSFGQNFTEESQVSGDDGLSDELAKALKSLEPDTAEIIVMRYYSQLSFQQLAELRKEPINTVLSKVHRGLKKLKELMKE